MNTRTFARLVALSASLAIGGCTPPRALVGDFVTSAVFEIAHPYSRVVVVHDETPPTVVVAQPLPAAPGAEEAQAPRGFDPVAGRAAADAVDIASCWPAGSIHGYGSARVTFDPSGSVDSVEVASPDHSAPPDAACVVHQYATVKLPAFRAPAVTVRTTFYAG